MTNVYNTWLKFLALFSHETRAWSPKFLQSPDPSQPTYGTSWKDGALCLVWVSWVLQRAPWVASNIQVLPKHRCKHNSDSVGVRLLWSPLYPRTNKAVRLGERVVLKKSFLTCCRMCLSLSVINLLWSSTNSSRYAWKRRVFPKEQNFKRQLVSKDTHMQGWVAS